MPPARSPTTHVWAHVNAARGSEPSLSFGGLRKLAAPSREDRSAGLARPSPASASPSSFSWSIVDSSPSAHIAVTYLDRPRTPAFPFTPLSFAAPGFRADASERSQA